MFVLQDWLQGVGCKQQSILMSGFRSPDQKTVVIKKCVRWLRGKCQINADKDKESYMQTITMSRKLIDKAIEELEYCSVHYAHHLADSFAVVAFHHPDAMTRNLCLYLYTQVAEEKFHFHPMARGEFIDRHSDKF